MAQNVLARTFELRCRNSPDFHLCCIFLQLGGKSGAGVPECGVRGLRVRGTGYGVPEYGVRGPRVRGPKVWKTRGLVENVGSQWKTRGLSAKHEENIYSPNNVVEILLFQIAMKINRRETRFPKF